VLFFFSDFLASLAKKSMPQKRKTPTGAKRRKCPDCQQAYRPMTDAMWRVILEQHRKLSIRHQKAISHATAEKA
jgi:hypothetical protein